MRIEHDMGGTTAAPKTIRFFVPYWIVNDSSLPLAYRVVEVEPLENVDTDSQILSKAVKSAKMALKSPTNSTEKKHSAPRRNIQVLEVIEDTSPFPCMLSPQDNAGRSGVTLFQSQKDSYVSPRVGIAVAMRHSQIFSAGISLLDLEKKVGKIIKPLQLIFFPFFLLTKFTSELPKVFLFVKLVGTS